MLDVGSKNKLCELRAEILLGSEEHLVVVGFVGSVNEGMRSNV